MHWLSIDVVLDQLCASRFSTGYRVFSQTVAVHNQLKKEYAENMKNIMDPLKLYAKWYSWSSPMWIEMDWIGFDI